MKKYIAGAGVAAALLTGSLAVAAVSPIGFAGAQDTTTSEAPATAAPSTDTAPDQTAPDQTAPPAGSDQRSTDHGPLSTSLDELVSEGVINQDQAEAIRSRVDENRQKWESDHPHMGHGGFGELRESAQAVADALGMPVEDVMSALRGGSSLNDLAAKQGVDPAAVSKILVDAANAKIDQALTDGKLDQAKADELKAKVSDNVGKVMDGSVKDLGGIVRRFGGHGRGPGGDSSDASGN
jgi:ribosomal protein S20